MDGYQSKVPICAVSNQSRKKLSMTSRQENHHLILDIKYVGRKGTITVESSLAPAVTQNEFQTVFRLQ